MLHRKGSGVCYKVVKLNWKFNGLAVLQKIKLFIWFYTD